MAFYNTTTKNLKPEKCPEAKTYEAYDWCKLSDNICIRNTGNSDFDVECEYYNEFLEEK